MCTSPKALLNQNQLWASEHSTAYFESLSLAQHPDVLWVGCSDSRVSANLITKSDVGEVFVHQNVANQASERDENFMTVLQYAVEVLKVPHIIVCGHYGCGGVKAVFHQSSLDHVTTWTTRLREIFAENFEEISRLQDEDSKVNRLVELNVLEQVRSIASIDLVREARAAGQEIQIHGWVYDLRSGKIRDLTSVLEETPLKQAA